MCPSRAKMVSVARVASETSTVSQPTKIKYESRPGTILPRTPKAARERVIVGALDFFPANELTPTRTKAPNESASNETFAPHQGQKSELGLPPRSPSLMKLIEFISRFIERKIISLPYVALTDSERRSISLPKSQLVQVGS